ASDTTDTMIPRLDWHIDVDAEPYTLYQASPGQTDGLSVEVEHFTLLPEQYRPATGDWLQVVGRWVTDVGHVEDGLTEANGFRTEIHPEELLVSSRPDPSHALGTLARVIITGAWQGLPLSFVVNPPARPSLEARLRWAKADEWPSAAPLTIQPWPKENPNHLICTLTTDDTTPLLVHPNGMV